MADYEIVNRIVVDDRTGPGVGSAERRVAGLGQMTKAVGASLMSMVQRGVMAFSLLGFGAARASRDIIGMHEDIAEAERGLGGLLSGVTGMGIDDSLTIARSQLQGLRKDAAEGVGELDNYTQGLQMIMGPGLQAGASLDDLRQLNRQALAVGALLRGQEGLRLAPMDIQQALTAGVGDRTTPIVLQALRANGMDSKEFNALDKAERIEAMMAGFAKFDGAVKLMGESFNAQMDTFKDRSKELLRIATKPLYTTWLSTLRKANDYLEKNHDRLEAIAETIGGRLSRAWETATAQAGTYAAVALAGGAANVASQSGLVGMLRNMSAARGAGAGTTFGFAKTGLESAGALAGMTSLGATLTVVGGIAAAVGVGFLAVQGALREYPGLLDRIKENGSTLLETFRELGDSIGFLNDEGSLLNQVGRYMLWSFGTFIWVFDKGVKVVSSVTTILGTFFQLLGTGARGLLALGQGRLFDAKEAFGSLKGILVAEGDQLRDIWTPEANTPHKKNPFLAANEAQMADNAIKAREETNITGPIKIEIKAEKLEDPARVATNFDNLLKRIKSRPTGPKRGGLTPLKV